jgi:dolichyl-phosphate-mannose-protein mannosyltransferase
MARPRRRGAGPFCPERILRAAVAGGYLLAVLANFYYLYPVLTGQTLPYTSWLARMWFSGWI